MTHFVATLLIASALIPTGDQLKTILRLEDELMAPCCYSQTIRIHMSAVAEEMREEVTAMVLSGKSEQEIIKYYKAKYGETILVVPDGKAGQIAYGVPIIAVLSALGLLTFSIRRSVSKRTLQIGALRTVYLGSVPSGLLERIRRDVGGDV